jgi:hypothetical protein
LIEKNGGDGRFISRDKERKRYFEGGAGRRRGRGRGGGRGGGRERGEEGFAVLF